VQREQGFPKTATHLKLTSCRAIGYFFVAGILPYGKAKNERVCDKLLILDCSICALPPPIIFGQAFDLLVLLS
jgi:hypothetical protein